jgi:hypothetical protein
VLQKAIEIATRKNGTFQYISVFNEKIETSIGDSQMPIVCYNFPEFKKSIECSYEKLIFSHDFAKAFWGDGTTKELREIKLRRVGRSPLFDSAMYKLEFMWQYHLQQMVLEENPIDYLRKFIES